MAKIKRKRIAKKPTKVYSTLHKYVGIVSKYAMEKEIASMRLSNNETLNRSAANIMQLIQRDYQQLQLN